jgi:drug/metabolite transporter (DMT)-like permease
VASDGSVLWLLAVGRTTMVPVLGLIAHRRGLSLLPARPERAPLVAIGMADLAATGLYGLATTRGALAIVAVVGSLYPVATILLARLVLHERIGRAQAVGVATALVGVAMVSAG